MFTVLLFRFRFMTKLSILIYRQVIMSSRPRGRPPGSRGVRGRGSDSRGRGGVGRGSGGVGQGSGGAGRGSGGDGQGDNAPAVALVRGRGRPPGCRGRGSVASAAAAKRQRIDLSSEDDEVAAAGSSSLNNNQPQQDQVPGCSHWPDRPAAGASATSGVGGCSCRKR